MSKPKTTYHVRIEVTPLFGQSKDRVREELNYLLRDFCDYSVEVINFCEVVITEEDTGVFKIK